MWADLSSLIKLTQISNNKPKDLPNLALLYLIYKCLRLNLLIFYNLFKLSFIRYVCSDYYVECKMESRKDKRSLF